VSFFLHDLVLHAYNSPLCLKYGRLMISVVSLRDPLPLFKPSETAGFKSRRIVVVKVRFFS